MIFVSASYTVFILPFHILALPLLLVNRPLYLRFFRFSLRLLHSSHDRLLSLYVRYVRRPWRKHKERKHIHTYEPRSLGKRKERRLSDGHIAQQTAQFLTRLPIELRLIIYKMVIVGQNTHWHFTECRNHRAGRDGTKRIRNTIRVYKSSDSRLRGASVAGHLCSLAENYSELNVVLPQVLHVLPFQSYLNLARTCRQIYLETISIPYGQF